MAYLSGWTTKRTGIYLFTLGLSLLFVACKGDQLPQEAGPLTIGIIADCQYADQPNRNLRQYRLSTKKLQSSVDTFNRIDLDHVFHLGDFIDTNAVSFDSVAPVLSSLKAPYTHVLGNHDFSVADTLKDQIPSILGLQERYFRKDLKGWRFLILDGNDISTYAYNSGSEADDFSRQVKADFYPELPGWNGAIGNEQLNWLKTELDSAESLGLPVILLCHFPVYPPDPVHQLWNSGAVLDLIAGYRCVKAWLNGHNHAGNYGMRKGVHFITFTGMVDTGENAFSIIEISQDKLVVKGYGREPDRELVLH